MPHLFVKSIIHPNRFGKIENASAHLIESGREAQLKQIKITNVSNSSLLISCDGLSLNSDTILKTIKGIHKRCDYLLISEDFAYFIELKSNSRAFEVYFDECIQKFKAVECILDYIDSVSVNFYDKQEKYFAGLQRRYVLFYLAPSINKTKTSLKPVDSNPNNKPSIFRSISIKNEAVINLSKLG